ncbi:hypothetical protein RchiOBHm_Chr1g0378091 [Rosa chinensis]|uniref:Uncharacterized protein n=1 Tax=Rosa chinensis TaxID=74649 RepID=A0A2P6SNE1_ROSCH|nr:hypothetical protein RchiOBHm_Chr1g0378091 [Rosa chinensis]
MAYINFHKYVLIFLFSFLNQTHPHHPTLSPFFFRLTTFSLSLSPFSVSSLPVSQILYLPLMECNFFMLQIFNSIDSQNRKSIIFWFP